MNSTELLAKGFVAQVNAAHDLRKENAALREALRDCLALMARHSWLTRDQPIIAAARAVLATASGATGNPVTEE